MAVDTFEVGELQNNSRLVIAYFSFVGIATKFSHYMNLATHSSSKQNHRWLVAKNRCDGYCGY